MLPSPGQTIMKTDARTLFRAEAPATLLFPTVYRGPSAPKRKRPCTADSTLRDVWERVLRPWLESEGTAASTLSGYQMDLCRWEEVTSASDFGGGAFGGRAGVPLLQGPRIAEISREMLSEVRERLKSRCKSVNTANRMIRSINVILHRASPAGPRNSEGEGLSDEWLHLRPWPKTPGRKRIAQSQQVGDWYARAEGAQWPVGASVPAPLWWRTLIVLCCTYGFRTRDNLDLDWAQVYWSPECPDSDVSVRSPFGWLMLTPRKTKRKKPTPLVLPLTKIAHAHLRACWEASDRPRAGRVLRCPIGRRTKRSSADGQASHRTVQDRLHQERCWQQRRAGITEPYTFQDLRKTCSTWLGRIDRELRRLVLGHASRDVNDEYYFAGVQTIREKLPMVPMPSAFETIFHKEGPRQQTLFD